MARAGLGDGWRCLLANDFDRKKGETYRINWGGNELCVCDVRQIAAAQVVGTPDLAWASFPCQDLSLAGGGAGLKGDRSGTFWPFWKLLRSLMDEGRGPRALVLENVVGTLTSHRGADFDSLCSAISASGYSFGALVVDARHFVPQSRPRLFIIAFRSDVAIPEHLISELPGFWHPKPLISAQSRLSDTVRARWHWWNLPLPARRNLRLLDLLEDNPADVQWHSPEETERILRMMTPTNRRKVEQTKLAGFRAAGAIYKRTRTEAGVKFQRAEVRFDDIAGCLRTPAGGSSRQVIMLIEGNLVRSRLISARETARLMGLPDSYILPAAYNEAYHLTGDGIVVPVVRHLAAHILEPVVASAKSDTKAA